MSELGAMGSEEEAQRKLEEDLRAKHESETRVRGVVVLLWVIAGATLLNPVLFLAGSNFRLVIGLLSTRVDARLFSGAGTLGLVLWLLVAILGAATFGALAWLGSKGHSWALMMAMILYAGDALVCLAYMDTWGAAIRLGASVFVFFAWTVLKQPADDSEPDVAPQPVEPE